LMDKQLTDLDQILAYFFDKTGRIELDDRLRQKLGRLEFAHDLFREWADKAKVVRLVMQKYDIQKSQAYQLVNVVNGFQNCNFRTDSHQTMA